MAYKYKTLRELENCTVEELLNESRKMIKEKTYLLDEATRWRDTHLHLIAELEDRLNILEFEELVAEDDRINSDHSLYDILCRIH